MAARQARRHNPLDQDLLARGLLRQKAPKRKAGDNKDGEGDGYVDSKASKKILELGRELEVEESEEVSGTVQQHDAFGLGTRFEDEADEEVPFDDDHDEEWADEDGDAGGADDAGDIDPADLATFDKFLPSHDEDDPILKHLSLRMSEKKAAEEGEDADAFEAEPAAQPGRNLADIILAKIAEHEAGHQPGVTAARTRPLTRRASWT